MLSRFLDRSRVTGERAAHAFGRAGLVVAMVAGAGTIAHAERIENQVAIFSALDKVTARISKFEVELNKTAEFGGIKVTPRACYSRSTTDEPKTTTFVEVDEVQLDGKEKRIFTGWMFAESPGLYGVEHPTFDVWLTECQKPLKATAQKAPEPAGKAADGKEPVAASEGAEPATAEPARRRVRR
ncbi:MAG: DUF2155 domain-containing protein [Hyphomicrobium sp.]